MNEFIEKAEDEEKKHAAAIDRIAASLQVPREEVAPVYESVRAELQQNAKIKTFLAIFTARKVEQLLRTMRGPFGSTPLRSRP